MLVEVLSIVAFVLIFEGLCYALAPQFMRKLASEVLSSSSEALRIAGAVGLGVGVLLLYLVK